jgi:hypothetical protein
MLIAAMSLWIVALPILAVVRWMAKATKPREIEIEDAVLNERLTRSH